MNLLEEKLSRQNSNTKNTQKKKAQVITNSSYTIWINCYLSLSALINVTS